MKSCKTVPIGTSAATWQKPRLCAKLMFALLGAASAVAFAEAEVKDNDAEIVSAKTVAESGIVYTNGDITETCEETGDAIYDLVFTYVDKSTGVLPGTLYSLSLKCTMADMTLTTESIQTGTITADADSPATTEVLSTMLAPFLSGHALKQTATEPVAVWTVAKAVASVGGFNYASLDDAIAAASDGATVTVVDDIGVAGTLADLSLNKSVTLVKGEGTNPTIRNYNFLCNGADSAIAVKGLTFAGTCMFRLQNCTSFTMEDCVANVTPYRAKTCVDGHSSGGNAGHPVFIHLGSGTATEGFDYAAPVSLTLKNNTIVPSNGTDGGDQISGLVYNQYDNIAWGYRHVADGSLIDGNTFYSAALPSTWCSFALMGAPATGAVVTFKNNTFYGTTKVYVYSPLDGKLFNADSILTGPMTWVSSGNAFNVDKSGTYGYGVYTVESGCAARVAILDDGTSTVNGSAVTLADCIDDSGKSGVGGFILLNGVKDADGKYTAGLLSRSMSDADKAIFLPEGFATVASATAEGRYEIGYDLPTGTGTKADPWVIDSRRHLKGFRNAVNDGTFATAGTYTIQTVDIDLEGEQWTDIGTGLTAAKLIAFNGCYDGQGHKISNLVLSGQSYCGFFAASEQGVFRNMSFVNVTSPADCPAVSVVVGDVEPAGSQKVVFDNITMSGSIFGKHNVGSISAWLQGTVEILNCTNLVNCTSTRAKVGGFAPYYGGTAGTDSLLISNCCNKGTVTLAKSVAADATSAAGGILAYAQSTAPVTFVDCVNEGEIVGTIETKDPSTEKYFGTTNLGGIMGCITGGLTATFTNCENSGSVSATVANVAQNAAVGGILGNVADGGATVALTGNLVTTDTTLTAEVASGKTAGAGAFVGDLATDNQTTLGAGNKAKATLAPFGSAKTVVGLGIGYTNGDYTEYCAEDGDSIYRLVMANVNMSTGVLPGTLYSYSLKCTMSGMTLTPESIQTGTITGDADSPATTEIGSSRVLGKSS